MIVHYLGFNFSFKTAELISRFSLLSIIVFFLIFGICFLFIKKPVIQIMIEIFSIIMMISFLLIGFTINIASSNAIDNNISQYTNKIVKQANEKESAQQKSIKKLNRKMKSEVNNSKQFNLDQQKMNNYLIQQNNN